MIVMDRSLGLLRDARKQPGFGARLRSAEGDEAVPKRADGEAEGEGSDGNGYVGSLKEGGGDGECVRGDLTSEGWRRGVFVSITSTCTRCSFHQEKESSMMSTRSVTGETLWNADKSRTLLYL